MRNGSEGDYERGWRAGYEEGAYEHGMMTGAEAFRIARMESRRRIALGLVEELPGVEQTRDAWLRGFAVGLRKGGWSRDTWGLSDEAIDTIAAAAWLEHDDAVREDGGGDDDS
jgi:hypothetical protein